jgi:DNA repair protein RadC
MSTNLSEIKLYYKPKNSIQHKITCSDDAYLHLMKFYNKNTIALQEQFVVLYLNRANCVLGGNQCFTGGITGTIADIRIILGIALKACSCNLIISHNHPSGNMKPSSSDKELTAKLKEAGRYMDINIVDHIIVSPTEGDYFSFADEGII